MPFNSKGEWVPENDSVATRVNDLTAGDSTYIQQARVSGMQSANRRGLLNSSMAAGAAQGAAIDRALPIASQDAQQSAQKNLTHIQGGFDKDRQAMVTAGADRNASLSAALEAQRMYLGAFGDLAGNKDIPAATRDAYIKHLLDTRSTGLDMIQQIYGINLEWGGKPGAATTQPTAKEEIPASQPFAAPIMPGGMSPAERKAWDEEQRMIAARNVAAFGGGGGLLSRQMAA